MFEDQFQPTTDSTLARMGRAASENHYGLLRVSPRRWAVVRRIIHLERKLVGYAKVECHPGGRLGATLSGPQYLTDYSEYQMVEGLEKLDREGALRALYGLTNPGDPQR